MCFLTRIVISPSRHEDIDVCDSPSPEPPDGCGQSEIVKGLFHRWCENATAGCSAWAEIISTAASAGHVLHGDEHVVQIPFPWAAVKKRPGPLGPLLIVFSDLALSFPVRERFMRRLVCPGLVGAGETHLENMGQGRRHEVPGPAEVNARFVADGFGHCGLHVCDEAGLIFAETVEQRAWPVHEFSVSAAVDARPR